MSKKKQPKYHCWSSRYIVIEPFPNTPIDFDKLFKALKNLCEGGGSSNGVFEIQTMETPGVIAERLAKKGIEAADIYERTTYTVMKNWKRK